MMRQLSSMKLWPWLAALIVLLAAWLLPLPRPVLSEEERVVERMPQVRADLEAARKGFLTAQSRYMAFVRTTDMTALLATTKSATAEARANPSDPQKFLALKDKANEVLEYVKVLQAYAEAGEPYLAQLQRYDSELMAWTRSLGPRLEPLRKKTWPIADHLRLYPPPVGDTPDPPWMTVAEVATRTLALRNHIADLSPAPPGSQGAPEVRIIDAINIDVDRVWGAGRSIERIESLHAAYYQNLTTYDGQVQVVASQGVTSNLSAGRVLLANGLNLLMGLALAGGLASIFSSRRAAES